MKKSTVLFLGGLGNQLFQYAFMVYLNEIKNVNCFYNVSYHKHIKVHSGFEADRVFDFGPYQEDHKNFYSFRYRLER